MHLFARKCSSSQIGKNDEKINELRFELLPQNGKPMVILEALANRITKEALQF